MQEAFLRGKSNKKPASPPEPKVNQPNTSETAPPKPNQTPSTTGTTATPATTATTATTATGAPEIPTLSPQEAAQTILLRADMVGVFPDSVAWANNDWSEFWAWRCQYLAKPEHERVSRYPSIDTLSEQRADIMK